MTTLHTPVAPVISKYLLGTGLLDRRAGDAVDTLLALLATLPLTAMESEAKAVSPR
ncbi:MAG: hypothetical protein AB2814_06640 [Candidatus Sedimenticola endophacoides]